MSCSRSLHRDGEQKVRSYCIKAKGAKIGRMSEVNCNRYTLKELARTLCFYYGDNVNTIRDLVATPAEADQVALLEPEGEGPSQEAQKSVTPGPGADPATNSRRQSSTPGTRRPQPKRQRSPSERPLRHIQLTQLLKQRLKIFGREMVNVPGDGNCQFHAIADQLNQIPNQTPKQTAQTVRMRCVELMGEDGRRQHFQGFRVSSDGKSWDKYLADMKTDTVWGDHLTLTAASVVFKLRINVISSLENFDTVVTPPFSVESLNEIYLGHIPETHYVSTRPLKSR